MDVTNKSRVINSLQNNEVDFALVSVLPKGLSVNSEILLENELYVIGNKTEKKHTKAITKSEINKMPLIFREEGSGTRFVMEQYFKKQNMHVRKKNGTNLERSGETSCDCRTGKLRNATYRYP